MKDIFAAKARSSFWEIMKDFAESLNATFPDCPEIQDWYLYMTNVVPNDKKLLSEGVDKWHAGMLDPLKKGCAKYAKAVSSITQKPAMVYHAIAYHDMEAADASSEQLAQLGLSSKIMKMSEEERSIYWQYLEELNRHSFEALRDTPPSVPTSKEIAEDIKRRKHQNVKTNATGAVKQGAYDLWQSLCDARGGTAVLSQVYSNDSLTSKISTLLSDEALSHSLKAHSPEAFSTLCESIPELKGDPPTEEQWGIMDKAIGLTTMNDSIPASMMSGIESMASKLAQDIASGKADLSTLNIEAIGEQVMSGIPAGDMSSFANNIDKILPALQALQPRPPG